MKDQNSVIEEETKSVKWDRGKSLFLESLYKADNQLRGCAHNQKCFNELIEIRDEVIDLVKTMKNPHTPSGNFRGDDPVKAINGISVYLLRGSLGPHYMKDWSEEHVKEWEEWVSTNA